MRRSRLALITISVAAIGGLIYGWGNGIFFPCGSVDRYLHLSNCSVIDHLDETVVEALVRSEEDGLTVVARDADASSQSAQRFLDISISGEVLSERTIASTKPDDAWMHAVPSADGKSILAAIWKRGVWLIDRQSGERLVQYEGAYSLGPFGYAPNGDVLIDNSSAGSYDRPVEPTVLRFSPGGALKGELKSGEAWGIYTTGISSAATSDGALMVQHEHTDEDSGIVALRQIEPQFATWGGSLMLAPIGGWQAQMLPRIFISPDNRFVAASFDSADEWGQINSALAVWALESRELLALVPTWRAEWENVVWLGNGRLAASRYNIDWHDSEVAIITYDRAPAH